MEDTFSSRMNKSIRIQQGEIEVGKELPWPVYDVEQTLLLKETTIITSEKQLSILIEKGLYRGQTKEEMEEEEQQKQKVDAKELDKILIDNPFVMKVSCAVAVEKLLTLMSQGKPVDVFESLDFIVKQVRNCCNTNANATLAAVHLSEGFSYSVLHPLHTAILCELLMRRLGFSDEQEYTVIAAAITMNIGMHDLQNDLIEQSDPLQEQQKEAVDSHPDKSVSILKKNSVNDSHWLTIVAQHHERINGEGYPSGLKAENIHRGAKVVALADMYAAMITPRSYRKPMLAQDALKDVFTMRGKEVDDELTQLLIREVGVYPPGSFVKLANNETAIVIKRATADKNNKMSPPAVCSIVNPRGDVYKRPSMRDPQMSVYNITGVCHPEFDEPINFPALWGYG